MEKQLNKDLKKSLNVMENKKTREFWNSLLTEESWKILQELKKSHNFILIGGWAVYIFTKQQKSKDIDIIVDINELQKFKPENLGKNDNLRKYEIKKQNIDVDIYLEHYSRLAIPVEDIKKFAVKVEGFQVACPELLLVLKQAAYKDRENSAKGEKDKLDIVSLLFFSEIDFNKYQEILDNYNLNYFQELKRLLKNFKDYNSLNISPIEFKKMKNKILAKM